MKFRSAAMEVADPDPKDSAEGAKRLDDGSMNAMKDSDPLDPSREEDEIMAAFLILNLFYSDLGIDKSPENIFDLVRGTRSSYRRGWTCYLDQGCHAKYGKSPDLARRLEDQISRLR